MAQTKFKVTTCELLDGHFWTCSVLNSNFAVQITCLLIITVLLEVCILVTAKFVWAKSYQSGSREQRECILGSAPYSLAGEYLTFRTIGMRVRRAGRGTWFRKPRTRCKILDAGTTGTHTQKMPMCLPSSVQGSRLRGQGLGFGVQVWGLRIEKSGFRVQGSGFGVQGSGFRVQGSGSRGLLFRVEGTWPHLKGRSPVCVRMCTARDDLRIDPAPHTRHVYGLSPEGFGNCEKCVRCVKCVHP